MKAFLTVAAVLILSTVCFWVLYQCWIDTKTDFRMVFREVKYVIRKMTRKRKIG